MKIAKVKILQTRTSIISSAAIQRNLCSRRVFSRLCFTYGFTFGLLILGAVSSRLAYADEPRFSTAISNRTVDALNESGKRFANSGLKTKVGVEIPTFSGMMNVQLEPHDIRSSKYTAEFTGPEGRKADPFVVQLFKGVDGSEGREKFSRFALVTNTITNSRELIGYLRDGENYYKVKQDPAQQELFTVETTSAAEAQRATTAACGTDHRHRTSQALQTLGAPKSLNSSLGFALSSSAEGGLQNGGVTSSAILKVVQIATDADYEYVQAEGGQTSANAEILSILNAVDAIYRAELGAALSVTYQHAWTTSSDPYSVTDAEALLGQLVNYWQANYSSTQTYDVAHLWTGKEIDSSTVGIAYVSALCSSYRYGLSQRLGSTSVDVPLAAHELGHNFGADHDSPCSSSSWVMCAFLQSNANVFSTASRNSIAAHLDEVSCLSEIDDGGGGGGGGGGGNSAPVLGSIGSKTVSETSTLTINLSATDANNDTLSYSFTPSLSGASLSGQTFTYVPPQGTVPGGSGSTQLTFTFQVSDGQGGTDSEAVVVTVNKTNRAPVISPPGSTSIPEGTTYTRGLQATDPDGDPLTYYLISGLPAGALLSSSGSFIWKPAGNQSGTYSIQFGVRDAFGGSDTDTLNLTVNNVPGVPTLPNRHALGDFSGSGKAAISVFRDSTGQWFYGTKDQFAAGTYSTVQFGLPGDVPVAGDYNGDRISDFAVYRPSESRWYVRYSGTEIVVSLSYGLAGDIPAPADFDADGRTDLAVFRPSLGIFIYQRSGSSSSADVTVAVGQKGDIPVPCDYDNNGAAEVALYRPVSGSWITVTGAGQSTTVLGSAQDIPVPADYDGNGSCERVVWRPSSGTWITAAGSTQYGLGGDVPTPADYDGDGDVDYAVFRPGPALWFLRNSSGGSDVYQLGLFSDRVALREGFYFAARNSKAGSALSRSEDASVVNIVRRSSQTLFSLSLSNLSQASIYAPLGGYITSGDFDGDSLNDRATYVSGFWNIYLGSGAVQSVLWGVAGDLPVSGDFDGDGKSDIAVFRPNNGGGFSAWYVIKSSNGLAAVYSWGLQGDVPIPGDYNGDGWTDPAVFRPSLGLWFVQDARSSALIEYIQWGLPGDVPRLADFDGDGRPDKIVWRNGVWYVYRSTGSQVAVQWGLPGDVPVPGRYSTTSKVDYAVYRPSNATLYVLTQAGGVGTRLSGLAATDQVVGVQPYELIR